MIYRTMHVACSHIVGEVGLLVEASQHGLCPQRRQIHSLVDCHWISVAHHIVDSLVEKKIHLHRILQVHVRLDK